MALNFLLPDDDDTRREATTARSRAMAYLNQGGGPAPLVGFEPATGGMSAFRKREDTAMQAATDAASAGLQAFIDRRGSQLRNRYAEKIAKTTYKQQQAAANRQNRSGLFGSIGKIGGAILGGVVGGPFGAGIAAAGGQIGSLFG